MKTTKTTLLTAAIALALLAPAGAQTTAPKAARPAVKKAAAAPAAKPAAQPAKPAVAAAKPAGTPVLSVFDEAAAKLKSKDPSVRRQGADFLGASRDQKAVPYLTAALSDEAAAVRASALDGLCQLVYRPAVPKIADMLVQDKDPLVRQQAASSLSYMADMAAGPALVKALGDAVPAVRYAAANTLGAMKYAPAEDKLIDLLDDAAMRRVAISSLGQLQSKKAAAKIFAHLTDPDRYTRLEAVRALGTIGDKTAVKELQKRLDRAEDPAVRVEAALALAKMGQDDGLVTAYEFVKSPDLSLKNQALEVIGAVGDKRSLQFVEELSAGEQNPVNKSMLEFTRQRLSARLKGQAKP
jgi:hypothetical protein